MWAGHTTGAIYVKTCVFPGDAEASTQNVWMAGPAAAQVTPAQLARQALATLHVPKPGAARSPGGNSDAGVPYTWVNLPTWFWAAPGSWRVLSATASLGAVSATVTVTPRQLLFAPGGGQAPVTCAGPGRAWTPADGDGPATGRGCAFTYAQVSSAVRSRTSIRWVVSWTGSGGTGGRLPDMTTTSTSPVFKVEQMQVVNR